MIQIQTHNEQTPWSHELRRAITRLPELLEALDLPPDLAATHIGATQAFRLLVPRPYLSRIEKGNLTDPLLLQVLPQYQELSDVEGYVKDPLNEAEHNPQKALVHKYESRVLVITTGTCAVNCRYCFRRHFPYGDNQLAQHEWQNVLDYVANDPNINEVILSGGDPLMLKDKILSERVKSLESIKHVKRLRIHTRLPVVIPSRIDDEFISWVTRSRLSIVLVTHINHANEIDHDVALAMQKLKNVGVTLLNQGVILKGVNDSVDAQVNLSDRLFEVGLLPYYMFTFDPVEGAAHFDIAIEEAQLLMGEVAKKLPGYLVPRLAKEIPGRASKTVFAPL
ncbi:EF-P beta-lysylation protein EpmB [Marinomonas balearica]|uniref:L-lysine 2,3-aminomutase n=1 Tax=Marinomonas balearica TaxID=491947 RepID=A0A4R6MG73_9GAMM|nr:EF-P beta-lysylation protein EpmB [Marinomonas balearica]TDP00507.1 L-lysine 2,3-aminomutase [Marinomonas balearica]